MRSGASTIKLSKNLSLGECLRSETAKRLGIKNEPHDDWVVENLRAIAEDVFQPLRDGLGVPLYVSSGYRSPDLNTAIGGAKRSQHMEGEHLIWTQMYTEVSQTLTSSALSQQPYV